MSRNVWQNVGFFSAKMSDQKQVINPETCLPILVDGPTYKALLSEGHWSKAQLHSHAQRKKRKSTGQSEAQKRAYITPSARRRLREKLGTEMAEKHEKWCRCVAHVATQKSVDNPYAICSKSIGKHGTNECLQYYNLDAMPQNEVRALAKLKKMTVSEMRKKAEYARQKANGEWIVENQQK